MDELILAPDQVYTFSSLKYDSAIVQGLVAKGLDKAKELLQKSPVFFYDVLFNGKLFSVVEGGSIEKCIAAATLGLKTVPAQRINHYQNAIILDFADEITKIDAQMTPAAP